MPTLRYEIDYLGLSTDEVALQKAALEKTHDNLIRGRAYARQPKLEDAVNEENQPIFNAWFDAEVSRNIPIVLDCMTLTAILKYLVPGTALEPGFVQIVIDKTQSSHKLLDEILDLDLETEGAIGVLKSIVLKFGYAIAGESKDIFWELLSNIPQEQQPDVVVELFEKAPYSSSRFREKHLLYSFPPELYLNDKIVDWILRNQITLDPSSFQFPLPKLDKLNQKQRNIFSSLNFIPYDQKSREEDHRKWMATQREIVKKLFGDDFQDIFNPILVALDQEDSQTLTSSILIMLKNAAVLAKAVQFDIDQRKIFNDLLSTIIRDSNKLTAEVATSFDLNELVSLLKFGCQVNSSNLHNLISNVLGSLRWDQNNHEKLASAADQLYEWLKTQEKFEAGEPSWVTNFLQKKRERVMLAMAKNANSHSAAH